jgi:hypothetical protein
MTTNNATHVQCQLVQYSLKFITVDRDYPVVPIVGLYYMWYGSHVWRTSSLLLCICNVNVLSFSRISVLCTYMIITDSPHPFIHTQSNPLSWFVHRILSSILSLVAYVTATWSLSSLLSHYVSRATLLQIDFPAATVSLSL